MTATPSAGLRHDQAAATSVTTRPAQDRLGRVVLAVSIAGGPLAYAFGGLLDPSIRGSGRSSIAANAAAGAIGNDAHLAFFVLASFLLPLGAIGLAYLARPRTSWLAAIGGLLAVVGWLPFSALAAQDDLTHAMARLPAAGAYARLWDRFTTDTVMTSYLLIYIVGHLVAYVLLAVALRRAGAIPRWAAAAMILASPVMISAFVVPGYTRAIGFAAVMLLAIASLPAARTMLHPSVPRAARLP